MRGHDGKMPDWYPLHVAAQELHCPPWELEDKPIRYRERALIFRNARIMREADFNNQK